MATAVVVHKGPTEVKPYPLDISNSLQPGETLTGLSVVSVSPAGLTVSSPTINAPEISVTLSAGADGVSYGVLLQIDTNLRTLNMTLAVLVSSQIGNTYTIRNPEAVQTLVDKIIAGDSAVGNALFTFRTGTDVANGYIKWELLDSNGIVYANGNAFEYIITNTGLATKVEGKGIITVPSDVPTNIDGHRYQIRWTLTLPDGQNFTTYENVSVLSRTTVPQGPEDTVELVGGTAALSIVLPGAFDHVTVELYKGSGSTLLVPAFEVTEKEKTPDGYFVQAFLDTTDMTASMEQYITVWRYWNDAKPNLKYTQSGRVFLINASVLSAVDDMKAYINRSYSQVAGQSDILFTVPYLLVFLRRGRDYFNGAHGMFTAFSMLDATSGIRSWWIQCAELEALRSQFIAEGEKAFNFAGQAISLDVDRTGYYDSAASAIQGRIDNELKSFKQNLIKKGITTGDGNLDNIGLRKGAIGAVGVNISPASNYGRFTGKMNGSGVVG